MGSLGVTHLHPSQLLWELSNIWGGSRAQPGELSCGTTTGPAQTLVLREGQPWEGGSVTVSPLSASHRTGWTVIQLRSDLPTP